MADIAKGLALGYSIGERAYNAYQQADEQRRIKAIQDAQTEQSYSPDDLARLQGLYNQQQEVVQQYGDNEAGAQAELARRGLIVNPNVSPAGQVQGFNYGLSQRGMGADRGAPGMDQTIQAPQGIAPRASFLGQQYDPSALTSEKMNSLRYGAMADVIGGRDPAGALRMRSEIRQNELRDAQARREEELHPLTLEERQLAVDQAKVMNPLQVKDVNLRLATGALAYSNLQDETTRKKAFHSALKTVTETQYDKPEDRAAATLAAYNDYDPEAAARLQTTYTQNQLARLTLQATQHSTDFKAAFRKGPSGVLDFLNKNAVGGVTYGQDSKNPNVIYSMDSTGKKSPFAQGQDQTELMRNIAGMETPDAFLSLAHQQTMERMQREHNNRMAKAAEQSNSGVYGTNYGISRDANGKEITVITGLQLDKKTGKTNTVEIPLNGRVVPMSALDPAKIAKQAESMVGTFIPGTADGKGNGTKWTEETATQHIRDQIIDSYLGKNQNAPNSVKALAEQMMAYGAGKKPGNPNAATAAPAPTVGLSTQPSSANNYYGPEQTAQRAKDMAARREAEAQRVKAEQEALRRQIQNQSANRPQTTYTPNTLLAPR